MSQVVEPEGWQPWNFSTNVKRVTFAEYECFGPGSNTSQRVSWSKNNLDSMFVEQMANLSFIDSEGWLQNQLF
ncbi:hypothetical protein QN277_028662 [Acacia crassicarpa]|uniref:pectinesterase n=1 Tax=Acacia crassicarpa TaxID=499986 RepID=A0AAE1J3J8_9FABA|nr:hypothetical protein QN277_028662 [Acacia crassicarpa]